MEDPTEGLFVPAGNKSENDESGVGGGALGTSTYSVSATNMSARYFVWEARTGIESVGNNFEKMIDHCTGMPASWIESDLYRQMYP